MLFSLRSQNHVFMVTSNEQLNYRYHQFRYSSQEDLFSSIILLPYQPPSPQYFPITTPPRFFHSYGTIWGWNKGIGMLLLFYYKLYFTADAREVYFSAMETIFV